MFWEWDPLRNAIKWSKTYRIPGMKWLNKSSFALSLGQVYEWFNRIGGAVFTAWGVYAFTMYAAHALRTKTAGKKVNGPGLRREDAKWVNNVSGGCNWMAQWAWKGITSPWLHAPIALLAAYLWGFGLKRNVENGHAEILMDQLLFKAMNSLAVTMKAARRLYEELKQRSLWRRLPAVQPLFTFFEVTAKDKKVANLLEMLQDQALLSSVKSRLSQGVLIRAYLLFKECQDDTTDLFTAIGRIDAYCGLAKLYVDHHECQNHYCFAGYVADRPTLYIDGMWNPFLPSAEAVANDIALGGGQKVQHYLITGPNAAGKSTNLKAIALTALMAQTCGIVPAKECSLSPFHVLETYLNITDDLQEGNSLFKKEVMRAGELLGRVSKGIGASKPALLLFDEMFNGTTPHEGISCAYSVAAHLAQRTNVISVVATHFSYLTQLPKLYPTIANMHVSVEPLRNGSWHRPYTMKPGVSNQHIAIDMLEEQVPDSSIMTMARQVLADVSKNLG